MPTDQYLYSNKPLPVGRVVPWGEKERVVVSRTHKSKYFTGGKIHVNKADYLHLVLPVPQKHLVWKIIWWRLRQLFYPGYKCRDMVYVEPYNTEPTYAYARERLKDFKAVVGNPVDNS